VEEASLLFLREATPVLHHGPRCPQKAALVSAGFLREADRNTIVERGKAILPARWRHLPWLGWNTVRPDRPGAPELLPLAPSRLYRGCGLRVRAMKSW